MTIVRMRFAKLGKIRFTSHRDVARMWERAFRRTGVAVAMSEGFSPRPKLAFGLALSTGHESIAEYLDADLVDPPSCSELSALLSPALPLGLDVLAAAPVERSADSLQQVVTSCTWVITLPGTDAGAIRDDVAAALDRAEIVATRTRKGVETSDDIRPAIAALNVDVDRSSKGATVVVADLLTQPRSLRPQELVAALWPGIDDECKVLRTEQWIEHAGARREVLPVDATAVPHAAVACV
ncbi:MAG: TIGR03936 family radical SAM-associated protein [Acidimicrobiia bacterium]